MHPNVPSTIIYGCQGMEVTTDKWIKIECTYMMEYYSAMKKMKFCHLQQHGWRLLC